MKKIIILIPVFNDWDSLKKLLVEIDHNLKDIKDFLFDCLVINDASSIPQPKITKPKNFGSVKILNMKENKGHARCNAFGIRYICKNEKFDYVIPMDGDGEDRPIEIKSLVDKIKKFPKNSVVAKRVKRSEGIFFQLLYQIHKILTLVFTGENINFGNYSCILKKEAEILSNKASLWSSYSGTVKKNLKDLNEIDSIRGARYFGPSKMSLFSLIIHSFSIIAVFKKQVFIRSVIFILILSYLDSYADISLLIFTIFVIFFNIIIFLISLREKENELINSQNNLSGTVEITH